MTIRQLIIKAMAWLIKHPKAITIGMGPIMRPGLRLLYNAENPTLDFDINLRSRMRFLDPTLSGNDLTLQSQIDLALPEGEDIWNELNAELTGGAG